MDKKSSIEFILEEETNLGSDKAGSILVNCNLLCNAPTTMSFIISMEGLIKDLENNIIENVGKSVYQILRKVTIKEEKEV